MSCSLQRAVEDAPRLLRDGRTAHIAATQLLERLRLGQEDEVGTGRLVRVLCEHAVPHPSLTEQLVQLLVFHEFPLPIIESMSQLVGRGGAEVEMVVAQYKDMLSQDRSYLVPIVGSLSDLALSDELKAEVFELTQSALGLVDEEDVPTVLRTLLVTISPDTGARVVASIRREATHLSGKADILVLEVLSSALSASQITAGLFIDAIDAAPEVQMLDLHVLLLLLQRTRLRPAAHRCIKAAAGRGALQLPLLLQCCQDLAKDLGTSGTSNTSGTSRNYSASGTHETSSTNGIGSGVASPSGGGGGGGSTVRHELLWGFLALARQMARWACHYIAQDTPVAVVASVGSAGTSTRGNKLGGVEGGRASPPGRGGRGGQGKRRTRRQMMVQGKTGRGGNGAYMKGRVERRGLWRDGLGGLGGLGEGRGRVPGTMAIGGRDDGGGGGCGGVNGVYDDLREVRDEWRVDLSEHHGGMGGLLLEWAPALLASLFKHHPVTRLPVATLAVALVKLPNSVGGPIALPMAQASLHSSSSSVVSSDAASRSAGLPGGLDGNRGGDESVDGSVEGRQGGEGGGSRGGVEGHTRMVAAASGLSRAAANLLFDLASESGPRNTRTGGGVGGGRGGRGDGGGGGRQVGSTGGFTGFTGFTAILEEALYETDLLGDVRDALSCALSLVAAQDTSLHSSILVMVQKMLLNADNGGGGSGGGGGVWGGMGGRASLLGAQCLQWGSIWDDGDLNGGGMIDAFGGGGGGGGRAGVLQKRGMVLAMHVLQVSENENGNLHCVLHAAYCCTRVKGVRCQ